jgi:hypothetical protein
MSEKPSYLGLLNAIAVAESQAHCYLSAWIDTTKSAGVKATLSTVAAREGEHGMSFGKRINELGYTVRRNDAEDSRFQKLMAIASSDRSDLEKMEKLGLDRLDTGDKPDVFDNFFKDHSIDIATGTLLGRYIAEEGDSARLLRGCYEALRASGASGAVADDRLSAVEAKLDEVCAAIGQLQTALMPKANGNGARSRTKVKAKN